MLYLLLIAMHVSLLLFLIIDMLKLKDHFSVEDEFAFEVVDEINKYAEDFIRCKECKYFEGEGYGDLMEYTLGGTCNAPNINKGYAIVGCDGFCARGEKDDGNEDEQRAEKVGEVGDEVEVVVEDDALPRSIIGHELVDVLVVVEHHGDGDDQGDGKEVMAQELRDDVPVQTTE